MKRKGLYVLATVAMLALAAGCGSNPGEENSENPVTEAVSTEAPEATATPEPTATPAPTATPKPANYMEANGIEVLGAGWHTGKGFIAHEADENGKPIMQIADCEYSFEVKEEDSGDGTKVIHATLNLRPYVFGDGFGSSFAMGGFVDLQTGKAFLPMGREMPQTTLLKQDGEEYELQLSFNYEFPSVTNPYYTERYTLVCPADYEDAGFYMTGWDYDAEAFTERAGLWKKLNFIRHGESDMMVFGVNKGLATEPEKTPVDGAELAEENYFEANGFSTKEEGTYIWLGMEAIKKRNPETGVWEAVSLEENEITSTFSVTEEALGDGTKRITGSFTEMFELVSEEEAKIPYTKCGIADKKTGLVYWPRTYGVAEPYVLEKDGEKISILVGAKIEEELGDGEGCSTISFTLICPEDYNDAVFYLTSGVEIKTDEEAFSNDPEVFSLNELKHGDCDLLFFR